MAHWQYMLWGLGGPAGFAAACRYIPKALLLLVGGFTRKPQRSRQCAEMVRLSRKDAKELPSYLTDTIEPVDLPAQPPTQSGQDNSLLVSAIEDDPSLRVSAADCLAGSSHADIARAISEKKLDDHSTDTA